MTSLDGPGFSLTLLKASPSMLHHLDTPVDALGWSPASISTIDKSQHVAEQDRVINSPPETEEAKVTGEIKCTPSPPQPMPIATNH